jgi:hypothetical protein
VSVYVACSEEDGVRDVFHRFAALPAFALQGEVRFFFGEFQVALGGSPRAVRRTLTNGPKIG